MVFPTLQEQITSILEGEPTEWLTTEDIISNLESTPTKQAVIRALNQLISSTKVVKKIEGECRYKTSLKVPQGIIKTDTRKCVFACTDKGETVNTLREYSWKNTHVYCMVSASFPREACTEWFTLVPTPFKDKSPHFFLYMSDILKTLESDTAIMVVTDTNAESVKTILDRRYGFPGTLVNPGKDEMKEWFET